MDRVKQFGNFLEAPLSCVLAVVTDTFSSIYCPGGYTLNAILEPIGIGFLEDIFSALDRARKRFTAWMFNIEG